MKTNTIKTNAISLFFASLLGVVAACDEAAPRSLEVNLERYGIAEVLADGDDAYRLIGEDGVELGVVNRTEAASGAGMEFEFADHEGSLAWTADDGEAICDGVESEVTACAEGLTVAAAVLESDGVDVPGFEIAGQTDHAFRNACTTVSTWIWAPGSCGQCLAEAQKAAPGMTHDSGTCSLGLLWISCTHTFCGGSEMEMLLE